MRTIVYVALCPDVVANGGATLDFTSLRADCPRTTSPFTLRAPMAQPTSAGAIDPRKIITPESFHVAPHLLGLPLASPSRRLAAILLDLLLCSILANVGGKVLFAL